MLYDNALLAHAYLEGFRATGEDRYARVARETLDFMLAELRTDDGGFASALDADSDGDVDIAALLSTPLDATRADLVL